jgi:hypothetical protein
MEGVSGRREAPEKQLMPDASVRRPARGGAVPAGEYGSGAERREKVSSVGPRRSIHTVFRSAPVFPGPCSVAQIEQADILAPPPGSSSAGLCGSDNAIVMRTLLNDACGAWRETPIEWPRPGALNGDKSDTRSVSCGAIRPGRSGRPTGLYHRR